MSSNFTISIIGAGRLGGALAIALARKNARIESIIARNEKNAETIGDLIVPKPKILPPDDFSSLSSEIVLITTQDTEIKSVSAQLAVQLKNKPFVFHASGALSSEILLDLKSLGCAVGSIHPLVSVSDSAKGAEKFEGAYFCVEGDEKAVEVAHRIVNRLGGNSFSVATEYKALYHAAAVTACGHLVALIDTAIEMLTVCGLAANDAQKILLPLIKSTVENLEQQTTAQALTGTFARADVETLGKHLDILHQTVSPEILQIYLQIGLRSLDLAGERGADKVNLEEMRRQILLAKTNLK